MRQNPIFAQQMSTDSIKNISHGDNSLSPKQERNHPKKYEQNNTDFVHTFFIIYV